jgi:hypothetical protein
VSGKILLAFIVVGALVTVYQGIRGFMFQWLFADKQRWTKPQRVFLLCIPDMVFYLVCTASGFLALFLAVELLTRLKDPSQIALGTSVLLVFLAVYGILGVTGQLPNLIQQGKLLPPGVK